MKTPAASCRLPVKAVPNAPRNAIVGWLGDSLKVKVHAPALENRANEELTDFLAESLGLHRRAVTLVTGDTSRQKLVQIDGLSLTEVKARLSKTADRPEPIRRAKTGPIEPELNAPASRRRQPRCSR